MNMEKVQKFGRYLSNMVQPNIGAFIAWGLITALFIPTGWLPNEKLAALVSPMLSYLLPLMIAYSGANMVYGHRGAVVGMVMTIGVIVGSSIPMFLGAMIAGPLGAFLIKKLDQVIQPRIKEGFEMLVNNFSAGILAMLLALLSLVFIGPAVESLSNILSGAVDGLVKLGLLPLVSIFVEPAKVFFLNNAINHSVFTPLGVEQVSTVGKSIYFMIEANPGPGLGLLIAYSLFGKGTSKETAPGAIIIHFFGGIHEIYFPYVLMNPITMIGLVFGGMTGVLTNVVLNGGLSAVASPGSIIAILAVTPRGGFVATIAAVLTATIVSFLISSIIVKKFSSEKDDLNKAQEQSKAQKAAGNTATPATKSEPSESAAGGETAVLSNIKKIVVACDAGMGSSAFGATKLRKIVKAEGLEDVDVSNSAISNLTDDVDLIITQRSFEAQIKSKFPNKPVRFLDNFMDNNFYKGVVEEIKANK